MKRISLNQFRKPVLLKRQQKSDYSKWYEIVQFE